MGLRELKKQRTRDTIVRVAWELFRERGFDATTIADIAEAADIAPRTFFGYFPSKEAVVFHDFDDVLAGFAARLRSRPHEETAFDAMRAWLVDWLARDPALRETGRVREEVIASSPALKGHDQANLARFGEVLAEAVAQDLDVPPDSLRPHLVSAAAMAALVALGRFDEDKHADEQKALAILDEALVFLQGGLDALRRHPPTEE